MCSDFNPVVPDTWARFRDEERRTEPEKPTAIELTPHPTSDPPALRELLPSNAHVPAPFEPTEYRREYSFVRTMSHIDREDMAGKAALAVYGPHGAVSDQSVHLACQVTCLQPEDRTDEALAAYHKEKLWGQCQGDPNRDIYSSWVTATHETERVYDHQRTTYAIRRPRLIVETLDTAVQRPVTEEAFVIQTTDWGFVGTGAFLTPDPDSGEALDLATTVADAATKQAVEYQTPSTDPITGGTNE
jgi:hypothetical protein